MPGLGWLCKSLTLTKSSPLILLAEKHLQKVFSVLCLSVFLGTLISPVYAQMQSKAWLAIVTPMPCEAAYINQQLQHKHSHVINGVIYYEGTLADQPVVTAIIGVGKVNAAATASQLIATFHPKVLLLSGVAGTLNPKINIGDVVLGKQIFDLDAVVINKQGKLTYQYPEIRVNPQNGKAMPTSYQSDVLWLKTASTLREDKLDLTNLTLHDKPKILSGIIATTDAILNSSWQVHLMRLAKADVVEDEGSAVAQVCWLYHVPCLIIRAICDRQGQDITQYNIQQAANNAGKVTIAVITAFSTSYAPPRFSV